LKSALETLFQEQDFRHSGVIGVSSAFPELLRFGLKERALSCVVLDFRLFQLDHLLAGLKRLFQMFHLGFVLGSDRFYLRVGLVDEL
jgi:hypothetical protein